MESYKGPIGRIASPYLILPILPEKLNFSISIHTPSTNTPYRVAHSFIYLRTRATMNTDYSGTRVWVEYNQTLPNRRATPPRLLARSSANSLDFYRTPISPGARSFTSRTRFIVRKTPSPKRRVVKRRVSMTIFSSFAKSLKVKRTRAAAMGRALTKMVSTGRGPSADDGVPMKESRMILGAEQNLNTMHDEAELMDDLAQYLTMARGNNPFRTPPQTPVDADIDMAPSPPLSSVGNSPESLRSGRRERRSQMKSLQILGPEACAAVVDKWRKDKTV